MVAKRIFSIFIIFIFIFLISSKVFAAPLDQTDMAALNGWAFWLPTSGCSSGNSSSLQTLTPGFGAPDGLDYPNLDPTAMANAINSYISSKYPNSEMKGLGATIVADGQHSNVNPFIIVAIAQNESSLALPTEYNIINGNNAFGRMATSSQPNFPGAGQSSRVLWYKWSSIKASVDYTAPENQNIVGGGDEGSYLRFEYGKILDTNNYYILGTTYDRDQKSSQYGSGLKATVDSLVSLAQGGNSSSTSSTSVQTTNSSTGSCVGTVNCNANASTSSLSQVRQQVVCQAQNQLSIWESQPGYVASGSNSFSYAQSGYLDYSENIKEEWCADFVSWIYNQANYPLSTNGNWRVSSVAEIEAIGKQNGNFHWHNVSSGYIPKPGDIAVHGNQHVNLVVAVNNNQVTLIGGDQGVNVNYPGGSVVSEYTDNYLYNGSDNITGYVSPD